MVFHWAPFVTGDPDLAAAGVVHAHRQPAKRQIVMIGHGRIVVPAFKLEPRSSLRIARIQGEISPIPAQNQLALGRRSHPVKAAWANQVQLAGGHPVALIVAHGDDVVGADRHAVGRAKAGGNHFELRAVLGDPEQATLVRRSHVRFPRRAFGKIEIASRIGV